MLTRESIEKMDEAQLRQQVLIPLLTKMGFKDVYHYHGGAGEQGKDIVFWKPDELGTRENVAIVAKASRMNGQSKMDKGSANEVQMQIRQCFNTPYTDKITGRQQTVQRVWVISNKRISKEAIDGIISGVGDQRMTDNVRFIDEDRLWELVTEHLLSIQPLLEELRKHAQSDSHYQAKIAIESGQTWITLDEKYPGASKDKPVDIKAQFTFPDDEKAKEFNEAYRRLVETGETLEIPGEYVQSFDMPQFVRSLLGIDSSNLTSVTLSPVFNPNKVPVTIKIICNDGDGFTAHYVPMRIKQGGIKEATLISDGGDAPFEVELKASLSNQPANFTIRSSKQPYDAAKYRDFIKTLSCLSKPCRIEMYDLVTRSRIYQSPDSHKFKVPIKPGELDFAERLALIQLKVGIPIMLPDRNFTQSELHKMAVIYTALTTGRVEVRSDGFSARVILNPERVEWLKDIFADGKLSHMEFTGEDVEELFGIQIPLGRIKTIFEAVRMNNLLEVLGIYDEAIAHGQDPAKEEIHAKGKFSLAVGDTIVTEYLDWMPGEEEFDEGKSALIDQKAA